MQSMLVAGCGLARREGAVDVDPAVDNGGRLGCRHLHPAYSRGVELKVPVGRQVELGNGQQRVSKDGAAAASGASPVRAVDS